MRSPADRLVSISRLNSWRVLNLDMSLRQIATIMGWSLKHASVVIEHYAMVSPAETDEVLEKLEAAKKAEKKGEV